MPESELVVSTTTDSLATATAAANGNEAAARVPAQPPEVSEMDGSTVVSYNHPRSERTLLLERLAEAENDLESFTNPNDNSETVASTETNEAAPDETEPEPDPEIIAAVHQAAINDAIQHARESYYAQQQHLAPPQPALDPVVVEVKQRFDKQVAALGGDLAQSVVVVPKACESVLLTHEGGPQAALWLDQNPDQAHALCVMPESSAVAEVARLAARFNSSARRPISNAPAPLNPVRGSANSLHGSVRRAPIQ